MGDMVRVAFLVVCDLVEVVKRSPVATVQNKEIRMLAGPSAVK